MPVDQAVLGQVISEQMAAIESDYKDKDGEIGAVMSIVQVVPKDGGEADMRLRTNLPPVISKQLLRELTAQMDGEDAE